MKKLKVFNPYDNSLIDEISVMSGRQVEAALELAHDYYQDRDAWLKPHQRMVILERFLGLLQENKENLITVAAREGGKPAVDTRVEMERAILGVKTAIETMPHMVGREIPMNISPSSENRMAYTYREAVGVVLAISAFNHPLNLIIHQVVPAIASGCPVLVKPASTTPMSCLFLVQLLAEAGLPQALCQSIICDNSTAEEMVSDSRVSFLSFIGSGKVGWYLRSKLAPGAHCALEHGGAAPVIVAEDAELDESMPLLAKGGFYHAGQVCVSVQRVFVHQKIIKAVSRKLVELAEKLVVGDPLDEATEVGPLISPHEVKRVDDWVQQAIANGAKLLCGGKKLSDTCYAPTVLLDPPQDVYVSSREIFGPVVCLYSYKDRKQAIDWANAPPFFFQAAVLSKNIDTILDSVKRLNATAVMVNDHSAFRVDWMPFGGRRHSGLAMGGIASSMHDMTYEKMMVLRSSVL